MVAPFRAFFHLPSPESPTATPRGRQGQGFTEKGYEVRACLRPHGWQGPAGILAHGVPLGLRGQESSACPFHRLILQQNHSPVLFTWEFPVAPVLTFLLTSALCSDLEQSEERRGWRRERVELLLNTFAGPDSACSKHRVIPWNFMW